MEPLNMSLVTNSNHFLGSLLAQYTAKGFKDSAPHATLPLPGGPSQVYLSAVLSPHVTTCLVSLKEMYALGGSCTLLHAKYDAYDEFAMYNRTSYIWHTAMTYVRLGQAYKASVVATSTLCNVSTATTCALLQASLHSQRHPSS
jgi:hypothetical protein